MAYLASLELLFREPLLAKQGLALVASVVFPFLALLCQWVKCLLSRSLSVLMDSLLCSLFVVGSLSGTELLV